MILWSMYCIQCVLTLVITVQLRCSYADSWTCDFGKHGPFVWSNYLTKCGITQASSPEAWGTVSGRGNNGYSPQGDKSDGFLLGQRVNMQSSAMFQLPNLNLRRNSGLLSFHYKFFDPGESSLTISVCGKMKSDVNLQFDGNWKFVEGIIIYCNGHEPTVAFIAEWSSSSGRVALDNILVVSTPPPTTTTKATTTTNFKSSTSKTRTMYTTTKHRTTNTEQTTTAVTTSEWTRPSPRSSGSDSATTALVDTTFTEPLVSIPSRLEVKNKSRTVVAISLTVVVIIIVTVLLAVIIKRRKSRSSKVNREGQEITMTRSLNHNRENDYGIDNQTAMCSTYDTISEGVNPVQQSDQASNGDYGTEEMVVNTLYQSVDKDDMIASAIGGANPVQPSDQASNGDYGTEEMVVNILYQSVDRDAFDMIPSAI